MNPCSLGFGRPFIPSVLLCAVASWLSAQSLQITSPASGTTVSPGQTLSVAVAARQRRHQNAVGAA